MNLNALGLNWDIHPQRVFLNHGSFGLAPRELLEWRYRCLAEIEQDPVAFLVDALPEKLQTARSALASLIGAQQDQVVFVPSTTYGLNQLLQRLETLFETLLPGSEVLLCDHGYNATHNLVRFVAQQRGWLLRFVSLSLPLDDPADVVEAFAAAWSPNTRLLVIDHITSPTALIMPLAPLIGLARARGARVIVDGAHGPGSVPLNMDDLQPDAYVGNLHKWLCCPRGAAFIWLRHPCQLTMRPLVISHGANAPLGESQSRFHLEHDWIGTADPTPWLALPEVLQLFAAGVKDRFDQLMHRHQTLVQAGQMLLLQALRQRRLVPAICQAAMAALPLPSQQRLNGQALQAALLKRGFQVPVIPLQPHNCRAPQFLRISCFAYNTLSDYQNLAEVLEDCVKETSI